VKSVDIVRNTKSEGR